MPYLGYVDKNPTIADYQLFFCKECMCEIDYYRAVVDAKDRNATVFSL